tara:strand:+ start:463 stop:807 length:345 start_codon:yes stop_codon:yes gene_type:complete
MTKKCKFEVEVTYNPDYFAEGEICGTIKNAICDLNDFKENKFGRLKMCNPGKTNHGMTCTVKSKQVNLTVPTNCANVKIEVEDLMDETVTDPKMILPDTRVEELINEVKIAFPR